MKTYCQLADQHDEISQEIRRRLKWAVGVVRERLGSVDSFAGVNVPDIFGIDSGCFFVRDPVVDFSYRVDENPDDERYAHIKIPLEALDRMDPSLVWPAIDKAVSDIVEEERQRRERTKDQRYTQYLLLKREFGDE